MTFRLFALAAVPLLAGFPPATAQTAHKRPVDATSDASWMRDYTVGGKDIKWDPRFIPLLRASFPQHQWFWRDHDKFTPLPELVRLYIGVPGGVLVDQDRYVTAIGCVPHVCETRGMLWADTSAHPTKLIFVATGDINGSPEYKGPNNMLWVFSSTPMNFQRLPQPFLDSLQRWQAKLSQQDASDRSAYLDHFLFANIVQPTGDIVAVTPSVLGLQSTSGAKQ
jgi:hypothetical protein